jgi:phage RecT family recombinase
MADQLPAKVTIYSRRSPTGAFVGQWGSARFGKLLKYATERRFVQELLTRKDSKGANMLWACTPESLQVAVLSAASAGVSFDPGRGHAYIVPYGNQAKFTLGYRGIIALAFLGGTLKDIQANLVHAKDATFRDWTDESGRHLLHEATRSRGSRPGDALVLDRRYMNGGQHIEVLNADELRAVEDVAVKKGGAVWKSAFKGEMQKKVPVRRSSKFWPIDPDGHLARALKYDYQPGIDFDRAESPGRRRAGGQFRAGAPAARRAHRSRPRSKLADTWLRSAAQARGYAQIEQLPASRSSRRCSASSRSAPRSTSSGRGWRRHDPEQNRLAARVARGLAAHDEAHGERL